MFSIGTFRIISHYEAALFTARREEMCGIVEDTFRYLADRPQVHSVSYDVYKTTRHCFKYCMCWEGVKSTYC